MQLITRSIDEFAEAYADMCIRVSVPRLYMCIVSEPLPVAGPESGEFRVYQDDNGREVVVNGQFVSCWSFSDTRFGADAVMYRHLEARSFSDGEPATFDVLTTANELISRIRGHLEREGRLDVLSEADDLIRIWYGAVLDGYSDVFARQIQAVSFDSASEPVFEG